MLQNLCIAIVINHYTVIIVVVVVIPGIKTKRKNRLEWISASGIFNWESLMKED